MTQRTLYPYAQGAALAIGGPPFGPEFASTHGQLSPAQRPASPSIRTCMARRRETSHASAAAVAEDDTPAETEEPDGCYGLETDETDAPAHAGLAPGFVPTTAVEPGRYLLRSRAARLAGGERIYVAGASRADSSSSSSFNSSSAGGMQTGERDSAFNLGTAGSHPGGIRKGKRVPTLATEAMARAAIISVRNAGARYICRHRDRNNYEDIHMSRP